MRLSKTHLCILRAAAEPGGDVLFNTAARHVADLGDLVTSRLCGDKIHVRATAKGREYLQHTQKSDKPSKPKGKL